MSAQLEGPFRYRPMVRKEGTTLAVTERPRLYSPDLRIDFRRVTPRAPENEIGLPNRACDRYFLRWWHPGQERQQLECFEEDATVHITHAWKAVSGSAGRPDFECRDRTVYRALLSRISERLVTIIRAAIVAKQQRTRCLIRHERSDHALYKSFPRDVFRVTQVEYWRAQSRVIDEFNKRQQPDGEDSLQMILEEPRDLRASVNRPLVKEILTQRTQQQAVANREGMPGMPPDMDHQADLGHRPFLDVEDIEFVLQDTLLRSEAYLRTFLYRGPPREQDSARHMQQKDQKPVGQ